jgi:repressor LexA
MPPLTQRQREIYEFLKSFFVEHMRMPSFHEIGDAFNFRSPNAVAHHLKALERKRLIAVDPSLARSIRLVGYRVVLVPVEGEGVA